MPGPDHTPQHEGHDQADEADDSSQTHRRSDAGSNRYQRIPHETIDVDAEMTSFVFAKGEQIERAGHQRQADTREDPQRRCGHQRRPGGTRQTSEDPEREGRYTGTVPGQHDGTQPGEHSESQCQTHQQELGGRQHLSRDPAHQEGDDGTGRRGAEHHQERASAGGRGRDADHCSQSGGRSKAHQVRVGDVVSEHPLKRRPCHSEDASDEYPGQRAWEADRPQDRIGQTFRVVCHSEPQGHHVPQVSRTDGDGACQEAEQDQTGEHQSERKQGDPTPAGVNAPVRPNRHDSPSRSCRSCDNCPRVSAMRGPKVSMSPSG